MNRTAYLFSKPLIPLYQQSINTSAEACYITLLCDNSIMLIKKRSKFNINKY